MIRLKINDIGQFMTLLLSDNSHAFDDYLVNRVTIATNVTYSIDGHINGDYYTKEELDALADDAGKTGQDSLPGMIRWGELKSRCYSVIKGKKVPLSFKFELYLSPEDTDGFLKDYDITDLTKNDIAGLALNIRYDSAGLYATAAASLKIFTADRSVGQNWDKAVISFFNRLGISFDEE
ncbi:MAG: DUF5721 family protein [Lachnospiraceae bacterium]|nr:DUF5721 family protein [Lachnospiraceae bacterium]